jgi:hypothetical protein
VLTERVGCNDKIPGVSGFIFPNGIMKPFVVLERMIYYDVVNDKRKKEGKERNGFT